MKVVFLPLDERPCNYKYPSLLPLKKDIKLVLPPKEILSNKKKVCNLDKLSEWLKEESIDADYLILSLDSLLFGGIVPSRIHEFNFEEIKSRSDVLFKIKKNNPKIKIFANELIMRCPCYSLNDEEPNYFSECGFNIFRLGVLLDKESQEDITPLELKEKEELLSKIKKEYLDDFLSRREKNINALLYNLSLVKENIIDFFIIPQDDSSQYGFPSKDQRRVREYIKNNSLNDKIYLYPGADEVGLTLLSRVLNDYLKKSPKIYAYYASSIGKYSIPSFEDRPIDITLSYHISATKSIRVNSILEADIVLFINNGSEFLNKFDQKVSISYDKNRCLMSFVDAIKYSLNLKKVVGIGDVAYCNEGDYELLNILSNLNLLYRIDGYAGWNTSSNTLGTIISSLISYYYSKDNKKKNLFLSYRYIEDYLYMSIIRERMIKYIEGKNIENINRFNLGSFKEELEELLKEELNKEAKNFNLLLIKKIKKINASFPWDRTFEIDLELKE